jgi:hypothetical protein
MGRLAEHADHVIGVDTHRDAHSAAAIAIRTGAMLAQTTVGADVFGSKRWLRFARRYARTRRVWAIESCGRFGAGLTMFLPLHGEWVVEVDRPKRPARRNGATSGRARRDPRRPRSDAARASRAAARPRRPRGRARAADHAPRRDPRPHHGDQPPQGAFRHRARTTAPPVAQHVHRRARLPAARGCGRCPRTRPSIARR